MAAVQPVKGTSQSHPLELKPRVWVHRCPHCLLPVRPCSGASGWGLHDQRGLHRQTQHQRFTGRSKLVHGQALPLLAVPQLLHLVQQAVWLVHATCRPLGRLLHRSAQVREGSDCACVWRQAGKRRLGTWQSTGCAHGIDSSELPNTT